MATIALPAAPRAIPSKAGTRVETQRGERSLPALHCLREPHAAAPTLGKLKILVTLGTGVEAESDRSELQPALGKTGTTAGAA
jgi:hypothetical protein